MRKLRLTFSGCKERYTFYFIDCLCNELIAECFVEKETSSLKNHVFLHFYPNVPLSSAPAQVPDLPLTTPVKHLTATPLNQSCMVDVEGVNNVISPKVHGICMLFKKVGNKLVPHSTELRYRDGNESDSIPIPDEPYTSCFCSISKRDLRLLLEPIIAEVEDYFYENDPQFDFGRGINRGS